MALSGGGGSGAGFGFVGSTFGQTDLVSPYLQMQEKEAQEMPAFAAPETIDHQLENSVHQNSVNNFITDVHVPLVSDPSYLHGKTQKSFTTPQDARAFNEYDRRVKETEVAISRLAEISQKSQSTNQKFASLVNDPNSDYFLYENQRTLSDYNLGLQFQDNVNELSGQGNYRREVVGGTPYFVVDSDYVKKVADEEIEDNDLLAILETEGISVKETDDGLYIDATSYPFSISEGNMMSAKDWADDLAKVKPSFVDKKTTTSDGVSYLSSDRNKYLNVNKYRAAIGQRVFLDGENSFDRLTGKVKRDKVKLTPSARRYALDNEIFPDSQGRYSTDDAQKIFDGMFQYQLDQQGFIKDKTEKDIVREGSGSFLDFNPQGMDVEGVPLMSVSGAGQEGYKGEYVTYNKGEGRYESPTNDVNVFSAITIKPNNVLVTVEGLSQARVAPSRLMVDDKGDIYLKAIAKREAYDMILSETEHAEFLTELVDSGILESKNMAETRWVKLTENNAANVASNLGLSPKEGQTSKQLLAETIPSYDPLFKKRQQARGGSATTPSTSVNEEDEFDFSND